jgi:hypothetical protein
MLRAGRALRPCLGPDRKPFLRFGGVAGLEVAQSKSAHGVMFTLTPPHSNSVRAPDNITPRDEITLTNPKFG